MRIDLSVFRSLIDVLLLAFAPSTGVTAVVSAAAVAMMLSIDGHKLRAVQLHTDLDLFQPIPAILKFTQIDVFTSFVASDRRHRHDSAPTPHHQSHHRAPRILKHTQSAPNPNSFSFGNPNEIKVLHPGVSNLLLPSRSSEEQSRLPARASQASAAAAH